MARVIQKKNYKNKAKTLFIIGGVLIVSAYISFPLIFLTFGLSVILTMLLLVSGGVCILFGVSNLLKSNTYNSGLAKEARSKGILSNLPGGCFQSNGSQYSNNSYAANFDTFNNNYMNEQAIHNMHQQIVEQQTMQQQAMNQQILEQQLLNQQIQHTMNEGIKAVTPFDLGGYVQGPGFNPSDTMAHDNMMNHMF